MELLGEKYAKIDWNWRTDGFFLKFWHQLALAKATCVYNIKNTSFFLRFYRLPQRGSPPPARHFSFCGWRQGLWDSSIPAVLSVIDGLLEPLGVPLRGVLRLLGPPAASWEALGASWKPLGRILAASLSLLAASLVLLADSWGSWRALEAILAWSVEKVLPAK